MESKAEKKIDPIIVHLGDMGPYQFWFCMLIFLSKFPSGWVQLSHIFIAAPTEYTCTDPNGTDPCSSDCLKTQHNYSVFDSTIVTEFDLVCGKKFLSSLSQSIVMIGIMFGSIIFGMMADRFGRRISFTISCILQLVTGLIVSLSKWFWFYVVFRFLDAFATGGIMTVSFVLIMEIIGISKRELMSIIYQLPFNLAHASLPVFSYFLRDWKWFNLSYSSFSTIYLIYICLCIESPRWLFTTGRIDKAIPLVEKIARVNKMPTDRIKPEIEEAYRIMAASAPPKKGTMIDLFRTPNMRKKTIVMAYQWMDVCMVYYGVSQYISTLSGNIFINVAVGGFLGIPGTIACIFMTKYLGRRITLIVSNFLSAFGLLIISMSSQLSSILVVTFATISLFGASLTFPNVYLYGGETFPTVVRSNGIGLCSFIGRLGSVSAPFITDLKPIASFLPPLIFGIISLIGGILTFFLPETRGFPLPETLEDGEKFGKKEARE